MNYEKPKMELVEFERKDIVTLSSEIGDGDEYEGDWSSSN